MTPFTILDGIAAPLIRPNIDTDAIIPSREMKGVTKAGLADGLFAGWRYTEVGGRTPRQDFVLNDPAYSGATILLGGENFGCGSSREHAVWALAEYGFRAVIAPSFSPIFQQNCLRNGLLAAAAAPDFIAELATGVAAGPQDYRVHIDQEAKDMLLHGLDAIALTLRSLGAIQAFRTEDRARRPWVYL